MKLMYIHLLRQESIQLKFLKVHKQRRKYIDSGWFLANGRAALGLKDLIEQAEANLVGVGIVIEKGFQAGGALLKANDVRLESLAVVESIDNGTVKFR